jgi:1,4-alpha-glucan branching enzyme
MSHIGAFTFVLHSHLPYARLAGTWPHGEEWLHEATSETYIPLLNLLNRLWDEGISARITLTLTPILLEQLADDIVQQNFRTYMRERIEAIKRDVERFEAADDKRFSELSLVYLHWYQDILRSFEERYNGNLVSAFRHLQQGGVIEIVTSAATHGFLPLLERDESIELQLRTAIESYKRHFGRMPTAIWLPECAYRPAGVSVDGRERVGLENFLSKHGLKLFFAETHTVERGMSVSAPENLYNRPARSYLRHIPLLNKFWKQQKNPTFQPYQVSNSDVAVLARNRKVSLQVWSADWGYPGEFSYREFHKKDGSSGMRYWSVTGSGVDLGEKAIYRVDLAAKKVQEHADHFYRLVLGELVDYQKVNQRNGIIAANFDTELFGHWWYEGVAWLEAVLRRLAVSEEIWLTTASEYIEQYPPEGALTLPGGSWGAEGDYSVWDNHKTYWMWRIIQDAEIRMVDVVQKYPSTTGAKRLLLDQAARELLLLQSSDWPFLVTTGQAGKYAVRRFLQHVERFNKLLSQTNLENPDRAILEDIWERDKVFPEIDYKWYKR